MCMAYFISYFKPYRGATDGAWYCESSAAIIYKKKFDWANRKMICGDDS